MQSQHYYILYIGSKEIIYEKLSDDKALLIVLAEEEIQLYKYFQISGTQKFKVRKDLNYLCVFLKT